jgi:L-fuculose-phosphate aldolase
MMHEVLRRRLIETAVAMNRSGINQGTSGNLSARCEDGMLITPSGMDYAGLESGDVVFVDQSGEPQGSSLPSSEWRIHQDIYAARSDAGAILHAHPTACTALACLRKPIPAFHYMVAVAGGRDIPCAPYATFGSQDLSDHVVEALDGRKACLMANHGLVCLAPDLDRAISLAIEVEQLARTYLQALSVGEPVILDDEEMDRVLLKFRTYGVRDA